MADKREALGLELRQIIQTDRAAAEIIQAARDKREEIERRTETEKAAILADAARRREEAERRVREAQQQRLEQKKADAQAQFAQSRERISTEMQKNRQRWIDEMVSRVTDGILE